VIQRKDLPRIYTMCLPKAYQAHEGDIGGEESLGEWAEIELSPAPPPYSALTESHLISISTQADPLLHTALTHISGKGLRDLEVTREEVRGGRVMK
jgi:hypothetical protein